MLVNFTAEDVAGISEASLLLSLVLFIPGYVAGWLTNIFDFRKRRLAMQAVLSTPLAVAILPVLIFLLGRYPKVLWTVFGASWFGFVVLFWPIGKRWLRLGLRRVPRSVCIGISFALAWSAIAIASLADIQIKDRLYFSSAAFDNSTHTAFTAAAARSIPAFNPFFATNPPSLLRYHYFWMLLCSLATRIGGVHPRYALYGGTVWAGIALMSLIVVSLKFFVGVRERFERKALIACSLLLVTGLDIIPTAYRFIHWHAVAPDMEWWNEQITSWVDGLLWAPHHIMSLVACMVGFMALRQPATTKYRRAIAILIAALAFASSAGLSILVSFTFAVFVLLWLPIAAWRRWWDDVARLLTAGAIALVAALPYLRTLMGAAVAGYSGGHFLSPRVRDFYYVIDAAASLLHVSPEKVPVPWLILLLLLPLNYFLELGFFFLAGILRMKGMRSGFARISREGQTGWVMVATSFLIGSFLRSTTIGSNDLGWRCFLLAQLVLLLWAALLIDDWWSVRRLDSAKKWMPVFAGVLLALGLIGTAYQVAMLRAYPMLVDAGKVNPESYTWLDQDRMVGARTFALRTVYDSLGAILPPDAVVQYNPYAPAFIPHQLYSEHSAAVGLPLCGIVFGGDFTVCASRIRVVAPLFNRSLLAERADLGSVCREYSINIMLVDDSDPVWEDPDSWVWRGTPLFANDHVRAFACGDQVRQAQTASAPSD